MSENNVVSVRREGPVARVTLERSASRNAVNLQMCIELREVFERIDTESDLRVVLLDAAGPVFCAGADLKERTDKDEIWVRKRRLASFAAYDTIERCRKPVVALVQGPVVGSGGEIVLSCDFIIASTLASFRFPEPQWGTIGATQRLQRVIGKSRAKELLFTGRKMPVEEAYALGLVARVVSPGSLAAEGDRTAAQIAQAPGLAIELTKQAVDLGATTDLASGIRVELAAIDRNLAEGDWRRGVDDFTKSLGAKNVSAEYVNDEA